MANTIERSNTKTEFFGSHKVRSYEMDISDYSGDGEGLTPADVGMNRFLHVLVDVVDGSGYLAQYDESTQEVRLFESGADAAPLSEVAGGSGNTAIVRVTAIGK